MLRRLRGSDGEPAGFVRILALLLIVALTLGALITAVAVLAPVVRWALPGLF